MPQMRASRLGWPLTGLGVAVGVHLAPAPAPRAASAECSEDNTGPVCKIVETCRYGVTRWPGIPGFTLTRICDPPEYHRLPGAGAGEEDPEDPRLE